MKENFRNKFKNPNKILDEQKTKKLHIDVLMMRPI